MKKTILAGTISLLAMTLSGCGSEVLDYRNAEISNGKIYKKGSNTPFSGKVTNLSGQTLLLTHSGFGLFSRATAKIILTNPDQTYLSGFAYGMVVDTLCDAEFQNGQLDGTAICHEKSSEKRVFEMKFKKGSLDGQLTYYMPKISNNPISTANFKDGLPDGKLEGFNGKTKTLVYRALWKNGNMDGQEEQFDAETGNPIGHSTWKNGQQDGEVIRYAPDGKTLTYKATMVDGKLNGAEENFSPVTGKPLKRTEWINGKEHGVAKEWDERGNLLKETKWENGMIISQADAADKTTSPEQLNSCVEAWTAAFQKENGKDAMVTMDQLGEWEAWCKKGKHP